MNESEEIRERYTHNVQQYSILYNLKYRYPNVHMACNTVLAASLKARIRRVELHDSTRCIQASHCRQFSETLLPKGEALR